jgi:hypothetical protein
MQGNLTEHRQSHRFVVGCRSFARRFHIQFRNAVRNPVTGLFPKSAIVKSAVCI